MKSTFCIFLYPRCPESGFINLFGQHFVVNAIEDKAVIFKFIAVFARDFFKAFGYGFVIELNDFTGFHTDEVIVMVAVVNFKDAVVAFEVVPFEDARLFELSENAVHGGKADVSRILYTSSALRWRSLSVVSRSMISRIFILGPVTFSPAFFI